MTEHSRNVPSAPRAASSVDRRTVLPPDIFHRFEMDSFWKKPEVARGPVPVILPESAKPRLPGLGG